jgi:hypothetical protein
MRVQTSAYTEILPALLYEPHRLAHTAAAPAIIEPWPSLWDCLSKEEILAIFERAWSRGLAQQLGTFLQEQGLAALYREFEDEDRELAEAGLGEYRLLLDDADRT